MARTQHRAATQFNDLSNRGKVMAVAGGIVGVAIGWFLPRWITLLLVVVGFGTVFVVQKLRGKI